MEINVPDLPPREFTDEGLTHDLVEPVSELGGRNALYYKCKADAPHPSKVKRALCDIVYVRLDPDTGKAEELVVGRAYFVDGDNKYRIILPKHLFEYSGWDISETEPIDGDWGTVKWVKVDHNL